MSDFSNLSTSPVNSLLNQRQGTPASSVSVAGLERTGRRMSMLQRYVPELVTSTTSGAMSLAESNLDDDTMLDHASSAVDYSNLQRMMTDLKDESEETERAIWAATPESLQKALQGLGYSPPERRPKKDTNRWGVNLPDFLPIDELTVSRDTPIIGPLGKLQEFGGEALEQGRALGGETLERFAWLGEQPVHLYRAWKYQEQEMNAGWNMAMYFSPGSLSKAWHETDKVDGYVRPEFREQARKLVDGNEQVYRLAHDMAMKMTPEQVIEAEGLEPGSEDATQLIVQLQQLMGDDRFKDAIHQLSVGLVSPGRVFTQAFGLDDTDSGWGRWVSGLLDAGFQVGLDPTLAVGKTMKAVRFGRYAFALESADDVNRGFRMADLALLNLRAREGSAVGTITRDLGVLRPWEMKRGGAVLRWADRVAEGFKTGEFGALQRDLPAVSTALHSMSDYHLRRLVEGRKGLDSTLGVIEWLQGQEGMLSVAGSRLGGGSPLAPGLMIPALTNRDRAVLQAKGLFQKTIDWSRLKTDPFTGEQFFDYFKNVAGALGNPVTFTRQMGRWALAHTAGNTGRVVAALTSHTPYSEVLPLFGEQSIPEFTRLVNSGIFAGMDRAMLDDYINDFVKHPDLVSRSTKVEQFLQELFKLGGVSDTDFIEKFVGRYRQAYALDGADNLSVGGIETRGARLVDAQHADALAIPNMRDFFAGSYKANWLRAMFHNPGAAHIDAVLGKAWKPSVLMRIGFIPRAAGEEVLHFILKHGPRTYLGSKGAIWQVNEELGHSLTAELSEARALGQLDKVNRLEQKLAEVQGAMAPVRSMLAASDRMFSRLMASSKNPFPWRDRLVAKVEAFDPQGTRGVVSGLEAFANRKSLEASEVFRKVSRAAHMPSKAELGGWMAQHWAPESARAARDMIENPWVARAFAEEISGSTMTPFEFRPSQVTGTVPGRIVRIPELRGGMPTVMDVPLKPDPGSYDVLTRTALEDPGFMESIYARHNWARHDRTGNAVLQNVLPRWAGGAAYPRMARKLGYGTDVTGLRADLNTVWAHAGETTNGAKTLNLLRQYIDGEEIRAGKGFLGSQLKALFEEAGVNLRANKLLTYLDDPKVPMATKRWLIYENVDPERLITDYGQLTRKMRNVARARLSRQDLYRHLSEMRAYANGGPTLAVPIEKGINKVYVPLMPNEYEAIPLGQDFIDLATQRIMRIGGYSPDVAQKIAQKVAATSQGHLTDIPEMTMRPLAAWGASDPRVADAVMATAEQVTGIKPTFGILSVPKDVVERSAGVYPQGLVSDAKSWELADDWQIEPWRLMHTTATDKSRRLVKLEINDEWWDDAELDAASSAFTNRPAGVTRRYSYDDGATWTTKKPDESSPFKFFDMPRGVKPGPEDYASAHKLPSVPPKEGWVITGRQASPGIGETEALERVADGTVDELIETLTTGKRDDLDDDVLHEIVEPLLRPDKRYLDEAGNPVFEPGYTWNHLVLGTQIDRLPINSYGPTHAAAKDYTWRKFVSEWFSGPVNKAISSIVRKPMFLHVYGKQLKNLEGLADLFVESHVRADAALIMARSGLGESALDDFARNAKHLKSNEDLVDLVRTMAGDSTLDIPSDDLARLRTFSNQRNHGLDLARDNALNRSMQLITPFIDDHRVRSAFQNYVGNFIPFLFAEEQFAKRWVRSVIESPEMIRKAQLGLNGFRHMGVIRRDNQGRDIFNYPLVGEAAQVVGNVVPDIFGVDISVPQPVAMTGDVAYTLPGFGDQMGVPSTGPLVSMGIEFLSRHYPEVAGIEEKIVGRGANRPYWQYVFPSGMAKMYEAAFGDMDSGQLASLNLQVLQTMAVNGQLPPEDATPREREHFEEQVRGQTRWLALARAGFGLNAPASPQLLFKTEALSDEFNELLQADIPMEEAVQIYLAAHPDIQPEHLLATTVSRSESEFQGLDMPTDKAFNWINAHEDLVKSFPAAASWLVPRADQDDKFSYRAWNQQLAVGLRHRKSPDEFLDDIYFSMAARDYFDARELHEEIMLTATGAARRDADSQWRVWKKAYFRQHPLFEDMLADPKRDQRRQDAIDQLVLLSADPESDVVPPEMREMVQRFDDYRLNTEGLRGDRRGAVVAARKRATDELRAWMLWHIQRHPYLSALYLRTIEPSLADSDQDAVTPDEEAA